MIDIKDISGKTRFSTSIKEGAKGKFTLMKEDYIILPFSVSEPIPFKLGDYVDLAGVLDESLGGKLSKIYEITDLQKPVPNTSTGGYDYQLTMEAYYMKWKNKIFKYTPEGHGQEAGWSLTASLAVHMGVFLRNLKVLGYTFRGTDFTFAADETVPDKAIALTYSNTNMLDALTMMAEELECEWWVTENVIRFGRCESGDAVRIELYKEAADMQRSESSGTFATRLYVFGGERNIPANYRPADESVVVNGVVQRRLMLPEGVPYLDAYPGMSQEEAVEKVLTIDDIYPKRTGTVSEVTSYKSTVENEDGTTSEAIFYRYRDTELEFSKEYVLEGQTLHVCFESGLMNGMDFEVVFNPDGDDTYQWEIVRNEDYGRPLPDDIIKPQGGDKYVLYGYDTSFVSDRLIPEAEQELMKEGQKRLDRMMVDDSTFTVPLYSTWVHEDRINRTFDVGQRINLINEGFFADGRISRVIGWEFNLDIPWNTPTYTIGESAAYSRIGSLEESVETLTYKGQTFTGSGSSVYVIRTNDSTPASDSNVFSALKSLSMFHRKDKIDENPYLQKFLKGVELGKFASGLLGSGGAIQIDNDGNSYAEFDYLTIRKIATFIELIIQEAKYVGGMLVVSPSGMTVSKVEETDTAYRCYFERTDGDRTLQNRFTVGTQARRQTFNLTEQAYYWRLVTAVGDDYVDLSKTDCDSGSTVPQAGDEIVGLGHRTDKTRQSAIIISAYGTDSPSIKYYQGIDSYSLVDKAIRMDYYDPVTGRFKSVTYGDTYVGSHDESTYFSYNQDEGARFKGKVLIEAGSTGAANISDLGGYISENVQVGAENLLLNTGFTGNYETEPLTESKNVSSSTQLYSKNLENWTGSATVIETEESASGYAVTLGSLSQTVALIANESYVISYKAKNGTVNIQCGNFTVSHTATETMERYSHNFTFTSNGVFSISGTATVCEIKLERGTIATDWCPSRNDRNPVADMFKSYWHLTDALQGITTFEGGLGLTSTIRFGQWKDGALQKVNACVSGIYNDDDDVAFSAGGDLDKAIYTVMLYKNSPTYVPTSEELKKIANCVITHGGRAILNDLIARGYIYATGGVFNGKVYADGGEFNHVVVADISSKNGTFAIDAEGNTTISNLTASGGTFTDITVSKGNFTNIEVDGLTAVNVDISGKITATSGSIQNVTVKSINSSDSDFYIDENGNVKIKDLTAEGGTFTNIEVDGLTAVNVDISGKITATSGKIGGWSIIGNNLECEGFDTKILVEASGTRFMRINAEEKIMCYVRSDESTGISIAVHGNTDDSVGLKVRCNAMGKGYAIKSYGSVLLDAREGERVELYGLTVNVRKVNNSSNFALQTNDDFIEFNNASAMTFNMSSNAKKGKIIYMKKISVGNDVTLTGGFRNSDGVGVSTTLTIGDEKSRIFVYDGNYWVQFYCG